LTAVATRLIIAAMDWRACGVVVVLFAGCADPDVLADEDARALLESGVKQADFGAVGAGTIASARGEHLAIMVGHPPVEPSADGWWNFETRQYRYSTADGTVQLDLAISTAMRGAGIAGDERLDLQCSASAECPGAETPAS
jgi:hypothetical protein